MIYAMSVVWLIVGSSICLWFIATLFSVISRKFLYMGRGEYSPRFIFQITSKECLETVCRAVDSIIKSCGKMSFTNYEIWVVTDNHNPLRLTDTRVRQIVVPSEFRCGSKYKARALEYARRRRIDQVYTGWIYFMDEENWITEQTIRAITHFAVHGNAKLASGPLMLRNGGSRFTWLGDSIRTSECRLCHLGHSRGWWPLHGDNLLLHCEVEKEIGWEFKDLTEDILFTAHALDRGYRTGWHGGELQSTSPASIVDFIKQRRRWFRGILQCVLGRNVGTKYKALEAYLLLCGLMGIFFIVGTVANLFYDFIPFAILWYYLYPTIVIFSFAYFLGCGATLKDRATAALFCWVFGVLEGIAAWGSLIKPPQVFDIIKKT